MKNKLPLGYWLKNTDEKYMVIGFVYGGHVGGECEISLPKTKLEKFCTDEEWEYKTVNKYYKIVFLGLEDSNLPISESEKLKDGIVPDDWE